MPAKPIIAVTMGDPSGIGPEIILKALRDPIIKKVARPLILGDWGVLQRTRLKGRRPKLICWQPGQRLLPMLDDPRAFTVCSLSALGARDSRPGVAAKIAGHGTFSYIRVAAKLALSKVADAIATAPLSKNILIDAGYNYPGHTELFAELGGTPECRMMLIGAKLRVVPVTGHYQSARTGSFGEVRIGRTPTLSLSIKPPPRQQPRSKRVCAPPTSAADGLRTNSQPSSTPQSISCCRPLVSGSRTIEPWVSSVSRRHPG